MQLCLNLKRTCPSWMEAAQCQVRASAAGLASQGPAKGSSLPGTNTMMLGLAGSSKPKTAALLRRQDSFTFLWAFAGKIAEWARSQLI